MRVETIKHRIVTLFFVEGIDPSCIKNPSIENSKENLELQWISLKEYIQCCFKQNSVDSVIQTKEKEKDWKYDAFYVKRFAYLISEWHYYRKSGLLSLS